MEMGGEMEKKWKNNYGGTMFFAHTISLGWYAIDPNRINSLDEFQFSVGLIYWTSLVNDTSSNFHAWYVTYPFSKSILIGRTKLID